MTLQGYDQLDPEMRETVLPKGHYFFTKENEIKNKGEKTVIG